MARLTSGDPGEEPTDPKVWLAGVFDRAAVSGVLEQLSPERLERLRREAAERIERMAARDGLPLRLEALIATGRR